MRRLLAACVWLGIVVTAPATADELSDRLQLASADRGRVVFGPCRICHSVNPADGDGLGPNLASVFGRVVGSRAGFAGYSPRFRSAGFVWTPKLMYAWLENPMRMYPDSSMLSTGVPDAQDRADLIAWLLQAPAATARD